VKRIVVGLSGASGAIYGIRFLELLRGLPGVEAHLVVSDPAKRTIVEETDWTVKNVEALATHRYDNKDIGAAIASGSFKTDGMVIVPCSVKAAASVAHCLAGTLLTRAADVTLKEKKKLILVPRETPLNLVHVKNFELLILAGATILPANPSFYTLPQTIEEVIDTVVARVLDHLGIAHRLVGRWKEEKD